jgi:hypothetical protein
MKETINLYNYFHNGDLFYSRILIEMLKDYFNINYYHNLKPHLFYDLDNVNEIIGIPITYDIHNIDFQNKKINTWIGQRGMKYVNNVNVGCTFENHFYLAKEICENLGITIDSPENYLPSINFEKIKNKETIDTLLTDLKKRFKNIVLISNGDVNSGQSLNFNFKTIIDLLSKENPEILFLITKPEFNISENVINVSDITKILPDLVEISYVSLFCDIIIGRASGPYCFSQNKENLMDENKTFIGFSHNQLESKFYQNMKSKFVWSNNYNLDNIYNVINNEINFLK